MEERLIGPAASMSRASNSVQNPTVARRLKVRLLGPQIVGGVNNAERGANAVIVTDIEGLFVLGVGFGYGAGCAAASIQE